MTDDQHDLDGLAAEYVLGTLEGPARAEAERRLQSDPGFAQLVDAWERRLAPLADGIAPVEPPALLWPGIQHALAARRTDFIPRRPAAAPPPGRAEGPAFWRWGTLGAGALAAALAGYIGITATRPELVPPELRLPTGAPASRYVAVLDAGGVSPALLVSVDPVARQMTVRPLVSDPLPAKSKDLVLELWLVAGTDLPPRSLGLLDPAGATALRFDLPEAGPGSPAGTGSGTALAVSLEPPGGSPIGLPTGPVIYEGPLLALDQP